MTDFEKQISFIKELDKIKKITDVFKRWEQKRK